METTNKKKSFGNYIDLTLPSDCKLHNNQVQPIYSFKCDNEPTNNYNVPGSSPTSITYNHLITPIVPLKYAAQNLDSRHLSPVNYESAGFCNYRNDMHIYDKVSTFSTDSKGDDIVATPNDSLKNKINPQKRKSCKYTSFTPIIRIDDCSDTSDRQWKRQKISKQGICSDNKRHNILNAKNNFMAKHAQGEEDYEVIVISDDECEDDSFHRAISERKHAKYRLGEGKKDIISKIMMISSNN